MTSPIPLRPLGFGDVLDGAFKILRAQWRPMALVAGGVLAPVDFVTSYLQRGALGGGLGDFFVGVDPSGTTSMADAELLAGMASGALILLLVYPLLFGALTRIATSTVLGEPAAAAPAFRVGLRRWAGIAVAWFVIVVLALLPAAAALGVLLAGAAGESVALVVLGGFGLLASVPAGAAVIALFIATAPAMVVEGLGPLRGLRRSATLVGRRILPVFGVTLVALALASVIESILSIIPTTLGMLVGETVGWVLVAAGSIVAGLVTTPFLASVASLLYLDGRIRREGLDLELAAERLRDGG